MSLKHPEAVLSLTLVSAGSGQTNEGVQHTSAFTISLYLRRLRDLLVLSPRISTFPLNWTPESSANRALKVLVTVCIESEIVFHLGGLAISCKALGFRQAAAFLPGPAL